MPRFGGTPVEDAVPVKPRFGGAPVQPEVAAPAIAADPEASIRGPRSFAQGMADMATFGFADEAAAGIGSLAGQLPGGHGKSYSDLLDEIRAQGRTDAEAHPVAHMAGQATGVVGNAAGLVRGGLSLGANALARGSGLGRAAMGGAADGAIVGGVSGFGSGEGTEDRLVRGATGALVGAGVGAAAPYAVAGVSAAARPVVSALMARMRPDAYAQRALGEGVARSGNSIQDIADILARARNDGQDMFAVADAMGHSGQRMLSTVARNPNEARQAVVETLQQRQMGQGERLSRFLAEGFDAPDTAAQRVAALTSARDTAADAAYGAARQGAGPVDVSGALRNIDDVLQPGVNQIVSPGNNIANDTVEGALSRARAMLTDGRSNLTDFSAVLRAKQDIDDQIGAAVRAGRGNQARLLTQVRTELDNALANASQPYAGARDAFRQGSQVIDAVDAGTQAASSRTRAPDNIGVFAGMSPDQQAAFRAGYIDPIIGRVEAASSAPSTNKARLLVTEKTGQEFPAFAAPGRADQLGSRVAREQRMFETANTALGGSRTADNLADAADMAQFDPSIISTLMSPGGLLKAGTQAVARALNETRGLPPSVLSRVGRTLMETDPQAALQALETSAARTQAEARRRAVVNAILANSGGSTAARLGAP